MRAIRNVAAVALLGAVIAGGSAVCFGCSRDEPTARSPAAPSASAAAPVALAATDSRVAIPVEGITCGSCVISIRTALKKLDGVKAVEASPDDANAVLVTFDAQQVTPERLAQTINDLGYKAGAPVKS